MDGGESRVFQRTEGQLAEIEKLIEMLHAALGKSDEEKNAKIAGRIDRLKHPKAQFSEKITVNEKEINQEKSKN